MLRSLIAYLLIVALIASNFSRLFIYAGFEMNKSYIATRLCENRDKPWLHCNGKCYFMKKIRQAEEKERTDERQSQKNLFQEAFFPAATQFKFRAPLLQRMLIPHNPSAISQSPASIFRPPQLG
jgi:hypothetical protein